MGKNSKFENKCRTCLDCSKGLQQLTKMVAEDKEETKSYGELLRDLTNIDIMNEALNDMPQTICECCIRKLKSSYAFVQQAHEANEKLWYMLNEKIDDKPINSIHEAQSGNQDCLEIKMEDDVTTEVKDELSKVDEGFKTEEPDHVNGDVSSTESKLPISKKETVPVKDVLVFNTLSDCEDDNDVDDTFDADFKKAEGISESDSDSESSNYSDWTEETKTTDNNVKSKTPIRSKNVKTKNPDDDIPTKCEQCEKVFPNASELKRHKRETHVPEELKVQCPFCVAKFGRRYTMNSHMRIYHKDKPIEEHIIQRRKRPRQYACEQCNASYTNKYNLLLHMKTKHDPNAEKKPKRVLLPKKRFLCTMCGHKFDTQYNLKMHIRRRHTGGNPFKCDICERAFYNSPSKVEAHRCSHTVERPFKCTICEKAFTTASILKNHHIRIHSNERPYKCTECEKAFKRPTDLKIHKRVHTGEKPYMCSVCHRTFKQRKSLKSHQTKQHLETMNQIVSY